MSELYTLAILFLQICTDISLRFMLFLISVLSASIAAIVLVFYTRAYYISQALYLRGVLTTYPPIDAYHQYVYYDLKLDYNSSRVNLGLLERVCLYSLELLARSYRPILSYKTVAFAYLPYSFQLEARLLAIIQILRRSGIKGAGLAYLT